MPMKQDSFPSKPKARESVKSMDVREAVARAICTACEENPDHMGDACGNDKRWEDYLPIADAAIAAIASTGAALEDATVQQAEPSHPCRSRPLN